VKHDACSADASRSPDDASEATSQVGHSFYPSASELEISPPPPVGRALLWCLTTFVTLAIAWASLSEVKIVSRATGQVITSGRSKVVQAPSEGLVAEIRVREGQSVSAGDILISLDTALIDADQRRQTSELREARAKDRRLRTLLNQVQQGVEREPYGDDYSIDHTPPELRLVASELARYRAQLDSSGHEIRTQQHLLNQTLALVAKLEQTLPLVDEQAAKLKSLMAQKLQPRLNWLDVERKRIEQVHDLRSAQARASEIRARIDQLEQNRIALQAGFRAEWLDQLVHSSHALEALESEQLKLEERRARHVLRSPVDGVVQRVGATSVGTVVSAGQALVTLVPIGERLELEALVQNRDIGFVVPGQLARVKLDAFPFTRYGTVDGTIRHVSQDAVQSESGQLVFPARVELAVQAIKIADANVRLTPGMTAQIDVTTGTRTIMDYLISPLLRFKDESFQER